MPFVRDVLVQLFPPTVKPHQLKYITSMYTAQLFVRYIRPLDLGGACEKTLTLASPMATILCYMVRP